MQRDVVPICFHNQVSNVHARPSRMRRRLTIGLLTDNNYSCSVVRRGQARDTFTVICAQVVIYNHYRGLQTSCLREERLGVFAGITAMF